MLAVASAKSRRTALILSVAGGILGLDRFYLGRYWTGLAKLLTLGALIWWITDIFQLLAGDLKPIDGDYADFVSPLAQAPAQPAAQPQDKKKPAEPAPAPAPIARKPLPPIEPKAINAKSDTIKPKIIEKETLEPIVVASVDERKQHIAITTKRNHRARKTKIARAKRKGPKARRVPKKRMPKTKNGKRHTVARKQKPKRKR